jgi:hypothetical protein
MFKGKIMSGDMITVADEAMRENNYLKLYEILSSETFDINHCGRLKWTLLLGAIYLDKPELVEVFLKMGANPNQANSYATPLGLAVEKGATKIIDILLADPRIRYDQSILRSKSRPEKIRKKLFDSSKAHEFNLMQLIEVANYEEIYNRLNEGALYSDADSFSSTETALHRVSSKGNLQIVRLLVEKGAMLSATTYHENARVTPSQIARLNGHFEVADFLDEAKRTQLAIFKDFIDIMEVKKIISDDPAAIEFSNYSCEYSLLELLQKGLKLVAPETEFGTEKLLTVAYLWKKHLESSNESSEQKKNCLKNINNLLKNFRLGNEELFGKVLMDLILNDKTRDIVLQDQDATSTLYFLNLAHQNIQKQCEELMPYILQKNPSFVRLVVNGKITEPTQLTSTHRCMDALKSTKETLEAGLPNQTLNRELATKFRGLLQNSIWTNLNHPFPSQQSNASIQNCKK